MSMSENEPRVFDEATAVITEGASGIGRALAEELANRGCEIVLADLQIELVEEVAATIRAAGAKPVHSNSMLLTLRLSRVYCKKLLRGQVVWIICSTMPELVLVGHSGILVLLRRIRWKGGEILAILGF